MSAADQLDDDFPHGTVEGYRRGCKGKICPGVADAGQSCSQAWTRYNADYRYRKEVDAEAKAGPKPVARPKLPAPRPVPVVDVSPPAAAADERAREAATGTLPSRAYTVVPTTGIPAGLKPVTPHRPGRPPQPIRHGTAGGYQKGCRSVDDCPGNTEGVTCVQARRNAQNATRAKKRAQSTNQTTAPAEEDTVNFAPMHTPELDATLAQLREQHKANKAAANHDDAADDKAANEEPPALAEDAQPTTPPEPLHTVPAGFGRRDEDGDLQDTVQPVDTVPPFQVGHRVKGTWDDAHTGIGTVTETTGHGATVTWDSGNLGGLYMTTDLRPITETETTTNNTTTKATALAENTTTFNTDPWTGHPLPTPHPEQQRSPYPATPYDDPRTLRQRLVWPDLRRAWLKGYEAAETAK